MKNVRAQHANRVQAGDCLLASAEEVRAAEEELAFVSQLKNHQFFWVL